MPKRAKASSKKRKPSLSKVARPLPDNGEDQSAAETTAIQPTTRRVAHTTDQVITLHRRSERDNSQLARWARRLTWVGLGLTLVAIWAFMFAHEAPINYNDDQTVARQFLTEIQKSNLHRAYLLTSNTYQARVTEDDFKDNFVGAISDNIPSSKPELVKRVATPGNKQSQGLDQVYYVFKFPAKKNKKEFSVGCTLVKQTDGWAVDGFGVPSNKSTGDTKVPTHLTNQ